MKTAFRLLLLLSVLAAAAGGFAVWRGMEMFAAPGPLQKPATVTIEPGEGPRVITGKLIAAQVIDNRLLFLAALRLTGDGAKLKAGEFGFKPGISMENAIDLIVAGKTVVRRLTIPEGMTSAAILKLIEDAPALKGEAQPVPEGELLPETYHYSLGDKRWELVKRMRQSMRSAVKDLWPGRARQLPISTPEEAVILASIVEKETGVASERPRVAAVFINRLRKGMRLQSDPTVIYAITLGKTELGRSLTKTDLRIDSPYNSYRNKGLPPGPIANPGRAAIAAVLNPLQTKELYFVADGTGGHAFAKTLAEHNRNVRRWRKLRSNGN
jgi:UPF0755 protein